MNADLQTILQGIALAILGWNARTTHQTAVRLAAITQSIQSAHEKDQTHDRDLTELRARITAVEIEVAKLKR